MIPQNQRSETWRKWRQDKIGASDSSAIMGVGFKSIGQLFDEKLGLRPPEEENEAMARGNALEEEARSAFEKETGLSVFPMVCVNAELPWQIASMDGMTIEKDIAVEIKCPGVRTIQRIMEEGIPKYYIPQLQHQMAVTGLNKIWFYAYYKSDNGATILTNLQEIDRDDLYIAILIEREKFFMDILERGRRTIKEYEETMDILKSDLYLFLEENE